MLRSLLLVATVLADPGVAEPALQSTTGDARVSVAGRVLVAGIEEPVEGALLVVNGNEVVTGPDGRFRLVLAPGTWTISIAAEGFLNHTVTITVGTGPIDDLQVLLTAVRFSETVEVIARGETPTGPAPLPVKPDAVLAQAGVADNVFRTLHTMAGVAAANDFESRISVRGGGPDQNLTVMDGVEIHNPYRLFGLTSAFNPEIVSDFELATGAFSVRHGDRLSSLLTVENRLGTAQRNLGGSASISITDANLVLEGKLPGRKAGSWLITGRRTYYDLIAERIVDGDLPSFADLQMKVSRELGPGQRLSFTGLLSRESTDATFEEGVDNADILTHAENDLVAITFDMPLGVGGSSRTIASYYRFVDALDFDGTLESDNRVSNTGDPASRRFGFVDVVFRREVEVRDLALRQEFLKSVTEHQLLDFGAEIHNLQTRWGWDIPGDRNPDVANGSSALGGNGLPDLLDSRVDSTRLGAWFADRFQVTSQFVLEPGVRVDYSTINKKAIVSPRLAAAVELNENTRLRGAIGLHSQSPGYEKLFQADYFVDLTRGNDLQSERSTHFILGVERDLARGLTARLEGFYKDFSDLIVGRLETEEERLARVSRYDFPPELRSSIPTEPEITSFPSNGSEGRAYGFDLYVAKRPTSASSRLAGWLSYTFSIADREAYGRVYPFDYDRRHALNVVASYRIGDKFDWAVTGRFASGFPFTPARGVRVVPVEDPEDPERLIPSTDEDGNLVWSVDPGGASNLNSDRFPYYARVDTRVTFRPRGLTGRWEFYLEAINVFDRKNAAEVDYSIRFDPVTGEPFLREGQDESGLPFLPTFGVRFRF